MLKAADSSLLHLARAPHTILYYKTDFANFASRSTTLHILPHIVQYDPLEAYWHLPLSVGNRGYIVEWRNYRGYLGRTMISGVSKRDVGPPLALHQGFVRILSYLSPTSHLVAWGKRCPILGHLRCPRVCSINDYGSYFLWGQNGGYSSAPLGIVLRAFQQHGLGFYLHWLVLIIK